MATTNVLAVQGFRVPFVHVFVTTRVLTRLSMIPTGYLQHLWSFASCLSAPTPVAGRPFV